MGLLKQAERDLPDVCTVSDVVDYFRLSRDTVLKALNTGTMDGLQIGKVWRIRKKDVIKWIKNNTYVHHGRKM